MHKRYQAFRNADVELQRRILALESRWLQIQTQITYLKKIWNVLHTRLQIHFNHVLSLLHTMLVRGERMVDGLIKSKEAGSNFEVRDLLAVIGKEGKLRRGVFALTQRDALDSLISDLRTWHTDLLGPSWFQLLRLPHDVLFGFDEHDNDDNNKPQIAQLRDLQKRNDDSNSNVRTSPTVALTFDKTALIDHIPLFASSLQLCAIQGAAQRFLLDRVTIPVEASTPSTYAAFQGLAAKMEGPDVMNLGFMRCHGLTDLSTCEKQESFALVFEVAQHLDSPRILRELLMEGNSGFSLRDRLTIARQLAKTVMSVHNLGLVHKNIRPETVIVFRDAVNGEVGAYILGFEQFRPVEQQTVYRGDTDWRKNLYRHPSRQGLHPEKEYVMQHDIYSLGVCLLELGLNKSFVLDPGSAGRAHSDVSLSQFQNKEDERKTWMLKERLQSIAMSELASTIGERYSNVVMSCLSCLDNGDVRFGDKDDFDDAHDILVSIRFMETVSTPMRSHIWCQLGMRADEIRSSCGCMKSQFRWICSIVKQ